MRLSYEILFDSDTCCSDDPDTGKLISKSRAVKLEKDLEVCVLVTSSLYRLR